MAKGTAKGESSSLSQVNILRINVGKPSSFIKWQLPPSKSHLIRALALFSQSNQKVIVDNVANSGEDVQAMRTCLIQMGVEFDDYDSTGHKIEYNDVTNVKPHPDTVRWVVKGVGIDGFKQPGRVLNAMNSGTALRFLAGLVARMNGPVTLDGDQSLRRRDSSAMWDSLRQAGLDVSLTQANQHLPVVLQGPWKKEKLAQGIDLEISHSSQPLSSWILASAALPCNVQLNLSGKGVSNRHSKLTAKMVDVAGGQIHFKDNQCSLSPYALKIDESYTVPGDASMASFAMLAAYCLNTKIKLLGWPEGAQAIGHEILFKSAIECGIKWSGEVLEQAPTSGPVLLDVIDSNDILPPLAALLCLGPGGRIIGASHAAYKESNRLSRTVEILESFGLRATLLKDGIEVEGGQIPIQPSHPVETFDDHRIYMTAVLLAAKTGGEVIGQTLHHVADENFLQRLENAGIHIERLHVEAGN
tara:strand:+ start:61388 stop:62803 length:1416 start_codon:yes stop_codon:yes gene_type:complete